MSVRWQFSETCGVTSGGSGWTKYVVNQYLEFDASLWQDLTVHVYQDESMLQQKMEREKKSREEEHAASVMVVLTRIDGDSNITDVFVKVRVAQSPSVSCFLSQNHSTDYKIQDDFVNALQEWQSMSCHKTYNKTLHLLHLWHNNYHMFSFFQMTESHHSGLQDTRQLYKCVVEIKWSAIKRVIK